MDLGQVFTKRKVADFMVSLFTNNPKHVLDPCFGTGVFIESILKKMDADVTGYEIDNNLFEDYAKGVNSDKVKLYNQDFLLSESETRFDGIILNPPYLRHEKINNLKTLGITKEKLNENKLFFNIPSTSNLYIYFIVKCIKLLADEGQMIIIFPSSWKGSTIEKKFLNFLKLTSTIVEEFIIQGDAFEDTPLVDVVILRIIKSKNIKKRTKKKLRLINNTLKVDDYNEDCLPSKELSFKFNKTLRNYSETRRGITIGANRIFINPPINDFNEHVVDIISTPKQIQGYNTENCSVDKILFIRKGEKPTREEEVYLFNTKKKIKLEETPKGLYNKILKNTDWYAYNNINTKGIIFSYIIRNNIKFIMNNRDVVIRDNFYIINPEIDKYLLFALLNNHYTYLQLEILGKKHGNGILKLQKYDIDKIILPNIYKIEEVDIQVLIALGKRLHGVHDGEEIIKEINLIISKYANISARDVTLNLEKYKKERLIK